MLTHGPKQSTNRAILHSCAEMKPPKRQRLKLLDGRFSGGSLSKLTPPTNRAAIRGTAAERGYDGEWRKKSGDYRRANPECVYCHMKGIVTPAALVDHLYPHGIKLGVATKAQRALFWSTANWVACCNDCHRSMKRKVEQQGLAAIDALSVRIGRKPLPDLGMRAAVGDALAAAYGVGGGM